MQAALEKAQIVIEKNRTINLTTRSAKVFFDAIEKPPKPTDKLARLAVAKNSQRQRYGTLMMVNAIERILAVSKNLGIIGFFVDAKIEAARRYYEQFGFISLPDTPLELFLPIATLQQTYQSILDQS